MQSIIKLRCRALRFNQISQRLFSSAQADQGQYLDLSEPEMSWEGSSHQSDDIIFEIVSKAKTPYQLVNFYRERQAEMSFLHQSLLLHQLNK